MGWTVGLALALAAWAAPCLAGEPLTAMSFNVRYGTAADGKNHWTARRGMVFKLLRQQGAAVVRFSRGRRYPSDHFPVTARVRLRAPEPPAPAGVR